MRRIALFFVSTVAIIVLLFSYKTSRPVASAQASIVGSAAHIVSGPATVSGNTVSTSAPPRSPPSAQTSTAAASTTAAGATAGRTSTRSAAVPSTSISAKPAATPSTTPAPVQRQAPVVVDGSAVDTQYGPVQVEVTIVNKKITAVTVPQYPSGSGRDAEINSFAIPQLVAEVLSAQSATIDGVSGATYTSQGFQTSLQSALDAANFGK